MLKKIGLGILAFFVGLISVILIAALIIWNRPQLLINKQSVQYVLKHFNLDKQITFDRFELDASSVSFFQKQLSLELETFCYVTMAPPIDLRACAKEIQVKLDLDFSDWQIRLRTEPTLIVRGSEIDLRVPEGDRAPSETMPALPHFDFQSWFGFLKSALPQGHWGQLEVSVERFDIRLEPKTEITGKALLSSLADTGRLDLTSELILKMGFLEKALPIQIGGNLDLDKSRLDLTVNAKAYHSINATLSLTDRLSLTMDSRLNGRPAVIDLQTTAEILNQNLSVDTKMVAGVARPPFLKNRKIIPPKIEANHHFVAALDLTKERWILDWETNLESPSVSGIELKMAGKGGLRLEPDWDFEKGLSFEFLRASLRIPQFAKMARELAWTTLQIPAPFYRMQGTVDLTIESQSPSLTAGDFAGALKSELQDGLQALKFDLPFKIKTTNLLKDSRAISAEASLNLNQIDIELPRLSPLNIPQFLPDDRLKNENTKNQSARGNAKPPTPLKWDVDFRVVNGIKPIYLRSNLISNPVPLKVNGELKASSSAELQSSFTVEVQKMNLDLFRRKIEIQRIRLDQATGRVTSIDGLLTHENSEVKIRMRILGSTEKPEVVWESDPPLTQRQIIAIIVFGKSLNELSQEESASTQNLERAFADGAFGLASLFLLASTPIESISYDPISKSYAARLKLGDRTSVSLGSDFEDRQSLAIRRQLRGAWSIKTEIQSNSAEETDQVSTFLEWFKRF